MKATKLLTKLTDGGLKIKSTELVDIINQFRELEDGKAKLQHYDFYKKTKKEAETLKKLGLGNDGNFSLVEYVDAKGEKRPCYELTRDGMLQMLNSESTLVRYKTIEYINQLENTIAQVDKTVKTKGKLSESDWNKIQNKSIYLTEEIYDRKSLRKYIRSYDPMKLDECIDTIAEMTIKMKGSIKHELLDVAIKELKTIDESLMKDTIKNTFIKDTSTEGIIILQDVKIGKFKKRIKALEQAI